MNKWLKISFVSSVVLNIAFVVGTIWARSYIRTQNFELAAINAEAGCHYARHILNELESGEPDKIEALKERLRTDIEQGKNIAEMWREAAQR